MVTGHRGQVVRSIAERRQIWPDHQFYEVGSPELDLAVPGSATAAVLAVSPDLIINAAAYTAVDKAEEEPERAFSVNATGAGELARAAQQVGAKIVQISTDYVFDGAGAGEYQEDDRTNPIGVYGRSKLEGEKLVRQNNPAHLILRTSWVYSPFSTNFVKTMLRLAAQQEEISVVADQHGNPTSALDIADAIGAILRRSTDSLVWSGGETYHLGGTGTATWADVAREVFAASAELGGPAAKVRSITTAEWPTKAPRPQSSMLNSQKFQRHFKFCMPHWKTSLRPVVARLVRGLADERIDKDRP
jgi:dTDP-4-dehydrorhamnose reductase